MTFEDLKPFIIPGLPHYLALSGQIFAIGIMIALAKRNAIAVLMGVELMLNAANLAFLAFSRFDFFVPGNHLSPAFSFLRRVIDHSQAFLVVFTLKFLAQIFEVAN